MTSAIYHLATGVCCTKEAAQKHHAKLATGHKVTLGLDHVIAIGALAVGLINLFAPNLMNLPAGAQWALIGGGAMLALNTIATDVATFKGRKKQVVD